MAMTFFTGWRAGAPASKSHEIFQPLVMFLRMENGS